MPLVTASAGLANGFALASTDDDADVRALLRRMVMPGAVSVAFTREPDYFAGEGLAGAHDRTIVHRHEGRLEGVARLSTNTLHRSGRAARLGYLGELRIAPDASHGAQILRDGYACLHEYVQEEALDACFTSIATDNRRARRVLEHGRRFGLPAYRPLADLVTVLLPVSRAEHPSASAAPSPDREELTAFLEEQSRAAHLTLTWDATRWQQLADHGVTPADFRVVRARGTSGPIIAAGAVWDQRAFRQTVVVAYDGALRWTRPLVNTLAAAGLAPALPAPGDVFAHGAILALSVDREYAARESDSGGRSSVWTSLLRLLSADAARRGLAWMMVTRDRQDPQLASLREHARAASRIPANTREYHTTLYAVEWPGKDTGRDVWDERPFRPEVALL
jgi:hypothetical protein